jgi:solute carrier family 25 phosphate transporter 23/24/25/41
MEHNNQINDHPSIPVLLLCGTASSICGQMLSYPLALVRTRLQAQEKPLDSSERMTQIFKQIWKNEGIRGLYRGLLPNIMKSVPAVSISYVVYENTKKNLS